MTVTPGSTPPCSSFTVPVTLPPDNCPNTVPAIKSKGKMRTIAVTNLPDTNGLLPVLLTIFPLLSNAI